MILVCGPAAEAFAAQMVALGLQNVRYLSPHYGEASMAKMLRSVFAKGVECLLLEMMSGAQRAGIEQYLWNDIMQFMHETPFQKLAENWIKTHPEACDRRWHEMTQVVQTLEELGVDPFMSRASEAFFERTAESHPAESFPQPPSDTSQVFRYLNETLWPPGDSQSERNEPAGTRRCDRLVRGDLNAKAQRRKDFSTCQLVGARRLKLDGVEF